jgi:hypothetical protein
MFKRLRQFLCSHEWKATRFQALVPGLGQQCTKCGKQRQVYYVGGVSDERP